MNFLRKHWYDLGGGLAIMVIAYVLVRHMHLTHYQVLMWLSLVSLFLHQLEEYRIVGTFPGMMNTVIFNSEIPDRYPLNTQTSLVVNVVLGWSVYALAAVIAEKAVWLGMATMVISAGNTMGHTFFFNIKGKTLYNAGLATCWLFFVPCICFFFSIIHKEGLVTAMDYAIGIPLGIAMGVAGILKTIEWMADKNTIHIFEKRHLWHANGKAGRDTAKKIK